MLILCIFLHIYAVLCNPDTVDHIENIEVEPTQIIITTSKDGPAEKLKIHIELIDIAQNKQVNPVDLSGLWLTITRGRYTIPFLRPDTWYGVRFRSENEINGRVVIHEDDRLIKTSVRDDSYHSMYPVIGLPSTIGISNHGTTGLAQFPSPAPKVAKVEEKGHQNDHEDVKNVMDLKIHRSLDGVENFESIYVTVSWLEHEGRTNQTTGVVHLRVICDASETKETIELKGDEDSVTIEITMDQKYDIEEINSTRHEIKAHISPLKCHKICWDSSLRLTSGFGDFTKKLGSDCREIQGTTSTTYLRNLKKVGVRDGQLIIETEVVEEEHGMVTVLLHKLGDLNHTDVVKKTFDTSKSNGKFVIDLDEDAFYAVDYEYMKIKPFHYASKTHFLVESPGFNSTRTTVPMVDLAGYPTTFDWKHDKPNSALQPPLPHLLITRNPNFENHDIILNIDPFCHENATKVRLEERYPEYQVDGVPYLCGIYDKMYFCDKNTTYTKCDNTTFCFSTSIIVGPNSYDSDIRCLNMTHHFPHLNSSPTHLFLCVSLFSVLFSLFQ